MGAALANKTDDTVTSFDTLDQFTTASISWTAGCRGVFALVMARSNSGAIAPTITGGAEVWSSIGSVNYKARRTVAIFISDTTPDDGTLTVDLNLGAAAAEVHYQVSELTGQDDTTPNNTAQTNSVDSGATTLTVSSVGIIGANDLVYAVAGHETASDGTAWDAGTSNLIAAKLGGTDVRDALFGTSTSDETPSFSWSTSSGGSGLVAVRFNGVASGDPFLITPRTPPQIAIRH